MNYSPDSTTLIVGLVLLAGISISGFLARKAFTDLADGLKGVDHKLDLLTTNLHANSTEVAVLRSRVDRIEAELTQVRADLREMSERS